MIIYDYLKKDHKNVKQLMKRLLATKKIEERVKLFKEIKYELLLHAKTEEDVFYKALEDKKPANERVEEAEDEHQEIEKYLNKLSLLEFCSEEWIEQFGEFKHSVTHHIEEEEGPLFEKAKKILSSTQAKTMADEMDDFKQLPKYQKKANLGK